MHKQKRNVVINSGIVIALSAALWAAYIFSRPAQMHPLLAGGRPLTSLKDSHILWQDNDHLIILQKTKSQNPSTLKYGMSYSELESIDLRTGKKRRISGHLLQDRPDLYAASLSPDRTRIALVTGRITRKPGYINRSFGICVRAYLTTINLKTGRQRSAPLQEDRTGFPMWTTDGKKIVLSANPGIPEIAIYDFDKNKIEMKRKLRSGLLLLGAVGKEKLLFIMRNSGSLLWRLQTLDISLISSKLSEMKSPPLVEADIHVSPDGLTPDGHYMLWQMSSMPPEGITKYIDNLFHLNQRHSIRILVTDLKGNAVGETRSIILPDDSCGCGIEDINYVQLAPNGRQILYVMDGTAYVTDLC